MTRWTGLTPDDIVARIEGYPDVLLAGATEILLEIVPAAEKLQQDLIEKAITPTGEARARAGGPAGRIETGTMINTTTAHVEQEDNAVVGRWGWDDPEDYFMYQDWGTETIAPALSLLTSTLVAQTQLKVQLRTLTAKGAF